MAVPTGPQPIAGPMSQADLDAAHRAANNGAPIQGPAGPTPAGPPNPKTAELQRWLHAVGYWTGAADGVWSEFLSQSLKQWQMKVGLEATGQFDLPTQAKLDDIGKFIAAAAPPATSAAAPTSDSTAVAPSSTAPAPGAAAVAADDDGLTAVPGGGQLWRVGSDWFVVYMVPGTQVPMAWKVDSNDIAAVAGVGNWPTATKTLTADEWKSAGVLVFGSSRELLNMSEHPFDGYLELFGKQAEIQPWLRDPEIAAIEAQAMLEGREPTVAELQTTNWWRTHNAQERAWMQQSAGDPAAARVSVDDNRRLWRDRMVKAGISDPHDTLVNWVSDRVTAGTWSESKAMDQIRGLANPEAGVTIDTDLKPLVDYVESHFGTIKTTAGDVRGVRALIERWIGPALARGWSDANIKEWAGKLAADPNQANALEEILRGQRIAAFPEFENPSTTYEDIAGIGRGAYQQVWGAPPDELDPLFQTVMRTTDRAAQEQLLRGEGLKRGVGHVVNSFVQDTGAALGGGVRRVS